MGGWEGGTFGKIYTQTEKVPKTVVTQITQITVAPKQPSAREIHASDSGAYLTGPTNPSNPNNCGTQQTVEPNI